MTKPVISIFLLFVLCSVKHHANEEFGDTIDNEKVASLILQRMNEIRVKNGIPELKRNHSLEKAAQDHVNYISKLGTLSHKQPSANKAKARQRVEFYGGKMQGVGENTAYIRVRDPALYKGENGQIDTVSISTYEQAADYMTYAWMNSPHHKENIVYSDYVFTGIKVKYSERHRSLFAVQVFAFPYKNEND